MIDRDRLDSIVREAGRIALARWPGHGHALESWDKEPGSPVSAADLAVDAFLRRELSALLPAAGWLSEETADAPERLAGGPIWLVDPIDGTRDFIRGRDGWAVSVALISSGRHEADLVATLRWGYEWDIGAAALIAREAGAAVTDAFGGPLNYNKRDPRAFGVLVSAPGIHAAAVERLAERARELAK
jgi:myo-inositol-1(or 4)-monophosphatase